MKDGVSRFPTPTRGGNIIDIDKAIQDCKEILDPSVLTLSEFISSRSSI